MVPASSDASFRRYFRLPAGKTTAIVMDAPPPHEDCRPFVDVDARLAAVGLNVPRIDAFIDFLLSLGGTDLHLAPDSPPFVRVRGELVTLNCAAIPKELAESMLFGAERGAHSGAHAATRGHLREAHGGVLFLDEVAELALEVQAKLLRALETKTVIPLGATAPRPADVAVVSATNADVRAAAGAGRFRHDLIPRLAQREVHLPPLRARPEEIPFLIQLERARQAGAPPASARFVEACLLRRWALNVRELFIAVDRAAAAARGRAPCRRRSAPRASRPRAEAPSMPSTRAAAPTPWPCASGLPWRLPSPRRR